MSKVQMTRTKKTITIGGAKYDVYPETVRIKDLIINTFVRDGAIDQDYALSLAELYESGHEVTRILITSDLFVVDGRNRIAGADLAGKTEIDAYVLADKFDKKTLLAIAAVSNMGGSRAPTSSDMLLAITNMVQAGASAAWIRANLPLPPSVVDKYMFTVRSRVAAQKISEARRAVATGMTIEDAAQRYGADISRLRDAINGKSKKSTMDMFSHVKRSVTMRNKSDGMKNKTAFDNMVSAYKDGEVTKEQVMDVLDMIQHHGNLSVRLSEDFRRRFFQST